MTPSRWDRLGEVFAGALERSGAEREEFLVSTCGQDCELLRQVRQLLEDHEQQRALILKHSDFCIGK